MSFIAHLPRGLLSEPFAYERHCERGVGAPAFVPLYQAALLLPDPSLGPADPSLIDARASGPTVLREKAPLDRLSNSWTLLLTADRELHSSHSDDVLHIVVRRPRDANSQASESESETIHSNMYMTEHRQ